jgi:DNA polymerase (family 10)
VKEKRRVVFKKGRIVFTKNPEFVLYLSKNIFNKLKPFSKKISFVGSIRRKEPKPIDIDIAVVPKNKETILEILNKLGKPIRQGEHICSFKIRGVKVEIYFAESKNWGAMIFSYTGPKGSSIGLRKLAKSKGMLLNQYGLFKNNKFIAGKTEKELYSALGKNYKSPELR